MRHQDIKVGDFVTHNHVEGQKPGVVLARHRDTLLVEWPWGQHETSADRVTLAERGEA